MRTVDALLEEIGHEVYLVPHDAPIPQCARIMSDEDVGSVVVFKNDQVAGILTWHDLVDALGSRADEVAELEAADLMTVDPLTTSPTATIQTVERKMVDHHVRHLPVVEGGEVIGIVSMIDLLHHRMRASEEAAAESDEHPAESAEDTPSPSEE